MRPSSQDRLNFQRALADTRLGGRQIHAVVPLIVRDQGFDVDTQSAGDVSQGLGEDVEQFRVYAFFANVRDVDQALKTFGQAPPGVEVGDTFITVSRRDFDMMLQVKQNEHAYIFIDGNRFRPSGVSVAGVGQVEEYVVPLQRFHPQHIAPGL